MDYSRENDARLADELLIRNILRIPIALHYLLKGLNNDCLPLLAIDWGRQILTAISGKRLNELMRRLRLSRSGKSAFRKTPISIKISDNDQSAIFPPDLEIWRRIIICYNFMIWERWHMF